MKVPEQVSISMTAARFGKAFYHPAASKIERMRFVPISQDLMLGVPNMGSMWPVSSGSITGA